MTNLDNNSPTNMKENSEVKIVEKVETSKPEKKKKKKKKKKSYKSLMRSIIKSDLTPEERIEKQRAKLDNILVEVNFKKVDII